MNCDNALWKSVCGRDVPINKSSWVWNIAKPQSIQGAKELLPPKST